MLEIGLPRDHPAVALSLRYLLAEQQDFGGWFQTTTHENFRTPMRETRYAVMALARAYPQDGVLLKSWGNRDDSLARLPRTDSLVNKLDDLENLWDVPTGDRPRFASEIVRLLADPEPLPAPQPRPVWDGWDDPKRCRPLCAWAIPPRSSGAPRPGP